MDFPSPAPPAGPTNESPSLGTQAAAQQGATDQPNLVAALESLDDSPPSLTRAVPLNRSKPFAHPHLPRAGQALQEATATVASGPSAVALANPRASSLDPGSRGVARHPGALRDDTPLPATPAAPKRPARLNKAPKRSILKAPPAPAQKAFSFKRDIIQPLNNVKLSYGSFYAAAAGLASGQAPSQHANGNASSDTSRSVDSGTSATVTSSAAPSGLFRNAIGRISAAAAAASQAAEQQRSNAAQSRAIPVQESEQSDPQPQKPIPSSPSSSSQLSVSNLKSVRFTMSSLTVVYPLNAAEAPEAESVTRQRVNTQRRLDMAQRKMWSGEELGRLYEECCRTREEPGLTTLRRLLKDNPTSPPRVIDLSNQLLTHGAVAALGDVLSVDFGLTKLVLDDCGLDDDSLKPLLHALLVSGQLPTLSLANNKRIRSRGWRLLSVFIARTRSVKYLDVSDNTLDRRAIEAFASALHTPSTASSASQPSSPKGSDDEDSGPLWPGAPNLKDGGHEPSSVTSIRLENCGLKSQALEALAQSVRESTLQHISLRRNRINNLGAVALAIMIRDYPLVPGTIGHVDPKEGKDDRYLFANSDAELGNTVTARQETIPIQTRTINMNGSPLRDGISNDREAWQSSSVRLRLQKQLETLPRTGSLLTLDVKNNDIKGGIFYIAQVLKRNRTLRVLNLSENKIDAQGLATLAEALKFNSTLETLDLSKNPCCGPSTTGVAALRAALTYDSRLVRIFLNSTDMTSEAAINLAERLPDVKHLLHLDLTENHDVGIAGVMALAAALKMNRTVRCLDLNIPANDADYARLSQDILQSCIRNTELAEADSRARGVKAPVNLISKSAVARDLQLLQQGGVKDPIETPAEQAARQELVDLATSGLDCCDVLEEIISAAETQTATEDQNRVAIDILASAREASGQVAAALSRPPPMAQRSQLQSAHDRLSDLIARAERFWPSEASTSSRKGTRPSDLELVHDPQPEECPRSPMESQSRIFTLEEGEIFRRAEALGAAHIDEEDEDAKDMSGDALKEALLEAQIDRVPRPMPIAAIHEVHET
ncbi:uncharacterized protein L969DRAFT_95783 [Mixia osmundae IAM 14324]|uniref:GAT domain-containing protein n=1 Tax=Mixia osmundae (strain CBS 9802 / IAM 14324 / JCM 22182 / KY 12970) TaxID=764103 RepID=G7DSL1_MIXOS|nr:uncharacterized protein L969DRAFT_95783 [Mixia osmundae IAM 14324]KEI37933.1 hypothetical protein L969DRAFT_95783 [Mixia osmundae IAM 14324]GAA93571.1 hypothetical protein E5Q_00215 [Mixia osmundae IAM 14324]